MKTPRSYQKRISVDAKILRYMRLSKKKSLNQVGRLVGISGSAVAHMEQGRMDISSARMETLVSALGYSKSEYLEFCDGKEIPKNLRDECVLILQKCDELKIQMLHPVIVNLAGIKN